MRFQELNGDKWNVYLTTRRKCKWLRADKWGGPYAGRAWWAKRCIYIERNQMDSDVYDTLLHEILHVVCRDFKLPGEFDEALVASLAEGLWPILCDIANFPPLP
jgi:hypothetical protein